MKKYQTIKYILVACITACLTWTLTSSEPVAALEWLFRGPQVDEEDQLTEEDLAFIQEVYNTLHINYIEDLDKETLIQGALKGMVDAVGDPYSEFLSPEETTAFDDSLEGSFNGIGVQFMLKDGQPTVIAPVDGTPAAKSGIRANDIFLEADGEELQGLDTSKIVQHIRGPVGSEVTLKIQRGTKVFDVTLTREEIPLTTVDAELDQENKNVGLVRVSQFASTTYGEMVEAIKDLRKKGADRFIFDFRFNPGGLLPSALSIANMFLTDDQIIMQTDDKFTDPEIYEASDKQYGAFQVTEPYVILVDEGSASASEILAAAIKENTDAPIVGVKTFGKGTVQTLTESSDYGELKLTIAKWLTPEGKWIHEDGVAPDVEVDLPEVATAIMLSPDETLKEGQVSEFVESAALMLNYLDYLEEANAYFSPEVTQAVKDFQKDHKLKETGQIDPDTGSKLMEASRDALKEKDPQYQKALETVQGAK